MFNSLKKKVIIEKLKSMLGDNIKTEFHSDETGEYYVVKIQNPEFEVNLSGIRVKFECPHNIKFDQGMYKDD